MNKCERKTRRSLLRPTTIYVEKIGGWEALSKAARVASQIPFLSFELTSFSKTTLQKRVLTLSHNITDKCSEHLYWPWNAAHCKRVSIICETPTFALPALMLSKLDVYKQALISTCAGPPRYAPGMEVWILRATTTTWRTLRFHDPQTSRFNTLVSRLVSTVSEHPSVSNLTTEFETESSWTQKHLWKLFSGCWKITFEFATLWWSGFGRANVITK